jgi:SAM-dependent methyltransferase
MAEDPPNDQHHHGHHHDHDCGHDHHHGHGHQGHIPSDELDHLDQMAEAHSRANPEALLKVNQQVVSLIMPKIDIRNSGSKSDTSDSFSVLDYGCGAGGVSILLAQQISNNKILPKVVGVDITPGMIAQAQENLQKASSTANSSTLQDQIAFHLLSTRMPSAKELLSLASASSAESSFSSSDFGGYDLAIMSFVLGHIAPKEAGIDVLKAVASTIKPGGIFALVEFLCSPEQQRRDAMVEDGTGEEGAPQHSDHEHHHSHAHDHGHNHEHIEFSMEEIRERFVECDLIPSQDFTPFEFEWGGHSLKSFLAVGTKR